MQLYSPLLQEKIEHNNGILLIFQAYVQLLPANFTDPLIHGWDDTSWILCLIFGGLSNQAFWASIWTSHLNSQILNTSHFGRIPPNYLNLWVFNQHIGSLKGWPFPLNATNLTELTAGRRSLVAFCSREIPAFRTTGPIPQSCSRIMSNSVYVYMYKCT